MSRQSTMDAFLGSNALMARSTPPSRSVSMATTLSCITLNNDAASNTSGGSVNTNADLDAAPLASTPPTSVDDNSSTSGLEAKTSDTAAAEQQLSSDPADPADPADVPGLSGLTTEQPIPTTTAEERPRRRARNSVATYNENTLIRKNTRRVAEQASPSRRNLSGKTLVPSGSALASKVEPCDQLVQDSIQVLNLDWSFDALSGNVPADESIVEEFDAPPGRHKTFPGRVSAAVDKTKTVLGKRARELLGVGKSGAKESGGRRSSLRARVILSEKEPELQEPEAKKRRGEGDRAIPSKPQVANAESQIKRKPVSSSRAKRWLRQGLYVGQEQGFDPRIKPGGTKRAQKAKDTRLASPSSKESLYSRPRKVLPLPMFAGKRLLEGGRDYKMPFDVFNPLPPGQPKPDEWRKTQRNVFVGDAADYWKVSKKLEFSACMCMPDSGCDENCFNRFMFYECDSSNCNVGPGCGNRAFDDLRKRVKAGGKYNIGIEVTKTEKKGHGVRSCRMFDPGQIILEYTGEIITQEESDRRMRTMYKDNECFYLMMFDQNMIIDATRGSIARFVNHSCEPNCKMVKWTVDGKPRMALFAGDGGVMTGEELTYDYNFDPFSAKNTQECHCGMPACRGVLGPRPKDREPKDALKSIVKDSSNTNSGGTITAAAAAATKRKLKEAMTEVKSKKRKLGTGVAALLKQKGKAPQTVAAEEEEDPAEQQQQREDRAARAALRANVKSGTKSKRVVAAKLTKKKTKVTTIKTLASPGKSAKGNTSAVRIRKVVTTIKGASGASKASKTSKTSTASKAKVDAKVKAKTNTKTKRTSKKATTAKPALDVFEMPA